MFVLKRSRPSGEMSKPEKEGEDPKPINPIVEYFGVKDGFFVWPTDQAEAIRFGRKEDAEAFKGPITAPFTEFTEAVKAASK